MKKVTSFDVVKSHYVRLVGVFAIRNIKLPAGARHSNEVQQ